MAKRKDTEAIGSSATPEPTVTPEISAIPAPAASATPASAAAKADLPNVDSPSISPADLVKTGDSDLEPAAKPIPELAVEAPAPVDEKISTPHDGALYLNLPRIALRPRHKRYALLAASVAVAAVLGGIVGTLASGGFSTPPVAVSTITGISKPRARMSLSTSMPGVPGMTRSRITTSGETPEIS